MSLTPSRRVRDLCFNPILVVTKVPHPLREGVDLCFKQIMVWLKQISLTASEGVRDLCFNRILVWWKQKSLAPSEE